MNHRGLIQQMYPRHSSTAVFSPSSTGSAHLILARDISFQVLYTSIACDPLSTEALVS